MNQRGSLRVLIFFLIAVIVLLALFTLPTGAIASDKPTTNNYSIPNIALTPAATAIGAEQLTITITNTYTDKQYTPQFHIVGIISNNSSVMINAIAMTFQAVDDSGKSVLTDYRGTPIESDNIYLDIRYLWPQETVPFDISCYVSENPEDVSAVVTRMSDGSWMKTGRANVTTENLTFRNGGDGYIYITGELVNLESTWVNSGQVVGATLDKAGKVVSAGRSEIYRTALAPTGDPKGRDRSPFVIKVPDPDVFVENVQVNLDPVPEEGPSSWLDVELTNTYFDSLGYYHIVGWLINNGTEPWMTDDVIAGLYGTDGKVINVGWGYMLGEYMAPGDRIPFDAWVTDNVILKSDSGQIDHISLQADGFRSRYLDILGFVSLSTNEIEVLRDPIQWWVTGTITNTSSYQLRTGEVFIVVYDSTGKLVARGEAGAIPPGERWFPGETLEFETPLYLDPNVDTSGYIVETIAQGWYGLDDEQVGGFRPSGPFTPVLTTYIPRPSDLSTEPKVVGGNLLLAALIMLPFAVAAELFTRMLGEKESTFKPMVLMRRFSAWIENKTGAKLHQPGLVDILKLLGVLFFYGLVFSLLEPDWKPFSSEGISLFLYLTLANGLVGLADDIIQWRKLRKWGDAADFAVRPTNFIIAAVSVAVSRIFSLIPGLLFGTPEALRTDNESLDVKKRKALLRSSAITAVVLILAFWLPTLITGMLLKGTLSSTGTKVVSGIEAFLLVVFAVALENTFVKMLGFSEGFGQALRKKNRWLWFIALVGVTFLFLHTLLNPRGGLAEAMEEGNVMLFLVASIGFMVIALIMWASTAKTRKAAAARAGMLPPNMPPPPPPNIPNPAMPASPPPVPGSERDQK